MAVLIALVFIGIVTAAMLRNTGSQSSASVGYGTMQTAAITAKSGIIATESFFEKYDNTTALRKIDTSLAKNNEEQPFIYGGKNTKQPIPGTDQYFSSQFNKQVKEKGDTLLLSFKIGSARKSGKKDQKTALAFYSTTSVTMSNVAFNPNNTFFLGGDLKDGNNGFEAFGNVTISGKFQSQNKRPAIFRRDRNTNQGDVFFNKAVEFLNDSVSFEVKAYFNDDVQFQNLKNNSTVFKDSVGFQKNVAYQEQRTMRFEKDIWINGDFMTPGGIRQYQFNMRNTGSGNFNYTNKLFACDIPTNDNGGVLSTKGDVLSNPSIYQGSCVPLTSLCSPSYPCLTTTYICHIHSTNVNVSPTITPSTPSQQYTTTRISSSGWPIPPPTRIDLNYRVTGFEDKKYKNGQYDILSELNMKPTTGMSVEQVFESRKEPELDMTKIDPSIIKNGSELFPYGRFEQADLERECNNPANTFYNGHLVVKLDKTSTTTSYTINSGTSNGKEFNGKVIFIVEDGVTLDAQNKFYNSGADASTMIYVKPGAKLESMGCTGTFRGLIYVDKDNSDEHRFKWGDNSQIKGAVLLNGTGKLVWNTGDGDGNNATKIFKDDEVLNAFGSLRKDASGTDATYTTESGKRVRLRAAGYYFY
jgi:hypothetical protein